VHLSFLCFFLLDFRQKSDPNFSRSIFVFQPQNSVWLALLMSFVENLQSMPRELKEVGKWQDWPGPRKMHYFSSIIGRKRLTKLWGQSGGWSSNAKDQSAGRTWSKVCPTGERALVHFRNNPQAGADVHGCELWLDFLCSRRAVVRQPFPKPSEFMRCNQLLAGSL